MRIIVYTCNFGTYDTYKSPIGIDESIQYLYFTDNKIKVRSYKRIPCNPLDYHSDIGKASRYPKICSHKVLPEHDYSVYVDASFRIITSNLRKLIEELGDFKIAQFYHGSDGGRNHSIKEESVACIDNNLDNKNIIQQQMTRYKDEGFSDDLGLYSGGFIIRKNDALVNQFNEVWWNEVSSGSKRDQLSEMYSLWKVGLNITTIEGSIYEVDYLIKEKHIKDR